MATDKIAKNLERFAQAVAAHDRENPTHTAWGIGLNAFDLERLGLDDGEEILPGIVIQADGGVTGNFRVLCDGDHEAEREAAEAEVVATMMPSEGEARWAVDFWIADADAAARAATERGGRVLEAPNEVPPFRSAVLSDPAGADFSVSQLVTPPG